MASIIKNVFENANLNGSNQLLWNHNLNKSDLNPVWFDENGVEVGTEQAFEINDDNNITLNCNEAITGFHTLIIFYDADTPLITGRRLFELTGVDDPADDFRFAIGKAGVPSVNITLEDLKALVAISSGALLAINNLNDLENAIVAQGNLDVYSRGYLNTQLASKASLYQAGSGSAIGVANTAAFPITNDRSLVDRLYVDTLVERVDIVMTEALGTFIQSRCELTGKTVKVYIEWLDPAPPSGLFLIAIIPVGYRPRYEIKGEYTVHALATSYVPYTISTNGEVKIDVGGLSVNEMIVNTSYIL